MVQAEVVSQKTSRMVAIRCGRQYLPKDTARRTMESSDRDLHDLPIRDETEESCFGTHVQTVSISLCLRS
jgi:hypothetical protein